jgi:hypothetical protein
MGESCVMAADAFVVELDVPASATGNEVQLTAIVQMAKLIPTWTGRGMAVLRKEGEQRWCEGRLGAVKCGHSPVWRELIICSPSLRKPMDDGALIAKAG